MFLRDLKHAVARTPVADRVLRPMYNAWQTLRYRDVVSGNVVLKNRYPGGRCFVLGTGPSINQIEFDLLRDEYTFGCSLLFKHKDFSRLNASFYSATVLFEALHWKLVQLEVHARPDGVQITPENVERVIADYYSLIEERFPNLDEVLRDGPLHYFSALERHCSNPDTLLFLNADCRTYINARGLFRNRRTHYVMNAAAPMERAPVLSHDLAARPTFLDGSLFFAIAASIYLGFKEIILCGCGYTYEPVQEFHFFDEPVFPYSFSESEASRLSDRFAAGRQIKVLGLKRAVDGYRPQLVSYKDVDVKHRIMKEYAEANGVRILNVVPDGFESPVYQKMSWNALRDGLLANSRTPLEDLAVGS